jgi:hypothetical protein
MGKGKRNKRPYSGSVGDLRNILAGATMPPQQRQEAYRLLGMLSKELGDAQEALEASKKIAMLKEEHIEDLKADIQFHRRLSKRLLLSLSNTSDIIIALWKR